MTTEQKQRRVFIKKHQSNVTENKLRIDGKLNINVLWYSQNEKDWKKALDNYYNLVKPKNLKLEEELDNLDPNIIENMTTQQFYDFLHDKYFVWKYTAANRLATTRKHLEKYLLDKKLFEELGDIHHWIFEYNPINTEICLRNMQNIKGMGFSGASGLLSLLFPEYFGTVDQFVVYRLLEIENFDKHSLILKMNPESLTLKDGVFLIEIM
mgnify:CR=1 FL=1